jgi:membrane protease YdiL (CAAX protease family)
MTSEGRLPARLRIAVAFAMVLAWAGGAALSRRVGFWTGLGSTALVLGALSLVMDRRLRSELSPSVRILGFGAVGGTLLAVATWTLYPVLARLVPGVTGEKIGLYAEFSTLSRLTAAILLPLIVVAEELVWRGLISNWLWPGRSVGRALRIASVATLYGMATLPSGSPLLAFAAFACGLVWSWLREFTDSVLAAATCHFVWAVLILFVHPVRLG